jgi:hypothetical protein
MRIILLLRQIYRGPHQLERVDWTAGCNGCFDAIVRVSRCIRPGCDCHKRQQSSNSNRHDLPHVMPPLRLNGQLPFPGAVLGWTHDAWCRFKAPSSRRDVAAGRNTLLCLHGARYAFDCRLSPHLMRLIIRAGSQGLPGNQALNGFPCFRRERLRALDLGAETLELNKVLDITSGRTDENRKEPDHQRGGIAPPVQQRTPSRRRATHAADWNLAIRSQWRSRIAGCPSRQPP